MEHSQEPRQIDFYNKRLIPTLTAIAFVLGIFVGFVVPQSLSFITSKAGEDINSTSEIDGFFKSRSDIVDEKYLLEVLQIFDDKYLGNNEFTEQEVTHGFIKGFVDLLEDRYTFFLTPEEAESYRSGMTGNFEGIGVVLGFKDDYTYIETVMKGQPAEAAGVLPGDIISMVDGENMQSKLPSDVASIVRGDKGSQVTISIFRENESNRFDELEITITRDRIEVDNVRWEKIDDKTAKIDIVQFSDESAMKFNNSWDKIVSEVLFEVPELENIVIDLRNNPGGYVFSVRYVMEEFFKTGDILMKERTRSKDELVYKDSRLGKFENMNIILLVNQGSASASEIFAGAVQDSDRGQIVGQPTVGKGVEQEVFTFPDGSMLLITFQEWLTPSGRRVTEEESIIPDFEIDLTLEDFKAGIDPQLEKALELFN